MKHNLLGYSNLLVFSFWLNFNHPYSLHFQGTKFSTYSCHSDLTKGRVQGSLGIYHTGKSSKPFNHKGWEFQLRKGIIIITLWKYICRQLISGIYVHLCGIKHLRPNSDQHQFSPNRIHRLSRAKSMRINKMITKRKIFDLLSNSLNLFFKKMYADQSGEFVWGYLGLKG